jgi:hypothetical protein
MASAAVAAGTAQTTAAEQYGNRPRHIEPVPETPTGQKKKNSRLCFGWHGDIL